MEFRTEILRRGRARIRDLLIMNFTTRTLITQLQSMRWRVEAFNDFIRRLTQVGGGGLQHEEGMREEITELESLMRGHHIEHNSSVNLRIMGR